MRVLRLTAALIIALLGICFTVVGLILCLTIVGLVIGFPLMIGGGFLTFLAMYIKNGGQG